MFPHHLFSSFCFLHATQKLSPANGLAGTPAFDLWSRVIQDPSTRVVLHSSGSVGDSHQLPIRVSFNSDYTQLVSLEEFSEHLAFICLHWYPSHSTRVTRREQKVHRAKGWTLNLAVGHPGSSVMHLSTSHQDDNLQGLAIMRIIAWHLPILGIAFCSHPGSEQLTWSPIVLIIPGRQLSDYCSFTTPLIQA